MHRSTLWFAPLLMATIGATMTGCGGSGAALTSTSAATGTGTSSGSTGTSGTSSGTTGVTPTSLSGTVTGATAATVTLFGTSSVSAQPDSSGNYQFTDVANDNYTIKPEQTGYVFTPISLAATVSGSTQTSLDFVGTVNTATTYTLSGTVSGAVAAGVVMTLNGMNIGAAETDLSGNYSFPGLVPGTYTISAALSGYAFTQPIIVTLGTADSTGNNFTATQAATAGTLAFTALTPLPAATVGASYSNTVIHSVSGGTAPYQYQTDLLGAGTPPLGMILNPNGTLTGMPQTEGTYTFSACVTDSAGATLSPCEPVSLTVLAAVATSPPATPTVSLSASPSAITAGGSTMLTWSATSATACTASGGWTGTKASTGTATESPTATTTYTLACTGTGGTTSASAAVTVTAAASTSAPTVTLMASPSAITAGATSSLTWSSTDATACTASGGWTGSQSTSGSVSKSPTSTTTYTLSCTGAGGTASASAGVTVTASTPTPTVALSASPTGIVAGASSTLTWSSQYATSCTASGGWTGTQSTSGTVSKSPTATTIYTLTCTGAGGSAAKSATVTVTPATSQSSTSWVYDNGLFDWPGDYSFEAVPNYRDTSGAPLSGGYDIKVTLTGQWGGWQPYAQNWNFNSAPYTRLVFALKPTVANQQWNVYFMKVGDLPVTGSNGQQIYVNPADYGPAPVVGQWGYYSIPLSALGVQGTSIYKFCIHDETGLASNVWYVDNVGFAP